jgi:hypothetical protein
MIIIFKASISWALLFSLEDHFQTQEAFHYLLHHFRRPQHDNPSDSEIHAYYLLKLMPADLSDETLWYNLKKAGYIR